MQIRGTWPCPPGTV